MLGERAFGDVDLAAAADPAPAAHRIEIDPELSGGVEQARPVGEAPRLPDGVKTTRRSVASALAPRRGRAPLGSRNAAIPLKSGEAALVGEAEPLGRGARLRRRFRIVELRQMHDAPIGAEIVVAQLREAVEAEAPDHQRVEMPGEEVGEVEGSGLLVRRAPRTPPRRRRRRSNAAPAMRATPSSASTRSSAPPVPQSP